MSKRCIFLLLAGAVAFSILPQPAFAGALVHLKKLYTGPVRPLDEVCFVSVGLPRRVGGFSSIMLPDESGTPRLYENVGSPLELLPGTYKASIVYAAQSSRWRLSTMAADIEIECKAGEFKSIGVRFLQPDGELSAGDEEAGRNSMGEVKVVDFVELLQGKQRMNFASALEKDRQSYPTKRAKWIKNGCRTMKKDLKLRFCTFSE